MNRDMQRELPPAILRSKIELCLEEGTYGPHRDEEDDQEGRHVHRLVVL
jgi:hypothetical protein